MPRRAWLLLVPPLLAAGCATAPQPYAPVQNVYYSALGEAPFWMVAIGDDRIVLRLSGETGAAPAEDLIWPRTLPRIVDGGRIWESGEGTRVIAIESRPGRCVDSRGRGYEDQVRVRLSGRELTGCGGRLFSPGRE
jgi:uncharacterized membrane protein